MDTRPSHQLFAFPAVDVGLSKTAWNLAVAHHIEHTGHPPTTLLVSLLDVETAYGLMEEFKLHRLLVVPVPGLPDGTWMICSPHLIVMSGGYAAQRCPACKAAFGGA